MHFSIEVEGLVHKHRECGAKWIVFDVWRERDPRRNHANKLHADMRWVSQHGGGDFLPDHVLR